MVVIGGEVIGDIQVNGTGIHRPLKANYRKLEQELMIRQLSDNPLKIPQPSRDDMRIIDESFKSLQIFFSNRFKALWVTNSLDGNEDYLVSEHVYKLVSQELIVFRNKFVKRRSLKLIKELGELITPPKDSNQILTKMLLFMFLQMKVTNYSPVRR